MEGGGTFKDDVPQLHTQTHESPPRRPRGDMVIDERQRARDGPAVPLVRLISRWRGDSSLGVADGRRGGEGG